MTIIEKMLHGITLDVYKRQVGFLAVTNRESFVNYIGWNRFPSTSVRILYVPCARLVKMNLAQVVQERRNSNCLVNFFVRYSGGEAAFLVCLIIKQLDQSIVYIQTCLLYTSV